MGSNSGSRSVIATAGGAIAGIVGSGRLVGVNVQGASATGVNIRNKNLTGEILVAIRCGASAQAQQVFDLETAPRYLDGLYAELVGAPAFASVSIIG